MGAPSFFRVSENLYSFFLETIKKQADGLRSSCHLRNLTECNCFPGNFAPDCPGANEELQVQGWSEAERVQNPWVFHGFNGFSRVFNGMNPWVFNGLSVFSMGSMGF